jgi:hypothetical protein
MEEITLWINREKKAAAEWKSQLDSSDSLKLT